MTEIYTGFHSTIKQITSKNVLEKRYGPKAQGFELNQAEEIVQHMRRFTTIANEIGIPIVPAIGHVIYDNGHVNKVDLAEYVPNIGHNLLQVMNNDVSKVPAYFRNYLGLFRQVWEDGFRISLDPPLTNFCTDSQNNLWYVDCMPPRQQLSNGSYISEWPVPPVENQQFIIDRYFSPKQTRVIYAQALRALLPSGISPDYIKETIIDVLGNEAEDAINITSSEKQRLLTNPLPTDVDLLRIMASEACGRQLLNQEELNTVYKLCHIGIGGIIPTAAEVKTASHQLNQIYGRK